ncbi:MAG TPA: heme exporter protein CcmB [Terriglobia bacterium]|nr:heme exporter protein CcmB [Terriglobia bacterium]
MTAVWTIFVKDLRVEWRNRETAVSMCVFGILVIFLFNFSFNTGREESLRMLPGLLWIAIAFAGILGFNRSFAAERENGCLEALTLAPIDPGAIFAGKLLANLVFLGFAEAVMVFVAALWYNLSFLTALGPFVAIMALGSLGYASLGTIFGAVAANTRMREVMLPVMQFPVAFWILVLSIDATTDALRGAAGPALRAGLERVGGVSLVYTVAAFLLFEYVLEE